MRIERFVPFSNKEISSSVYCANRLQHTSDSFSSPARRGLCQQFRYYVATFFNGLTEFLGSAWTWIMDRLFNRRKSKEISIDQMHKTLNKLITLINQPKENDITYTKQFNGCMKELSHEVHMQIKRHLARVLAKRQEVFPESEYIDWALKNPDASNLEEKFHNACDPDLLEAIQNFAREFSKKAT